MAYAQSTNVPVERTRAEIERLVMQHKCTQYMTGTDMVTRQAMVQFKAHDRIVRFLIELPDRQSKLFTHHERNTWRKLNEGDAQRKYEQATRTHWRALLLVIKAKLEAVESKIATFEEEFLAHIVMPNDRTIAQIMTPIVQRAYETGKMPERLLTAGEGDAAGTADGEIVESEAT